jgi:hypothetical protein
MARQARKRRCRPRNRSGGRLARLARAKSPSGLLAKESSPMHHWAKAAVRLRSKRLGLPSQGRRPKWLPDIWVPLPGPRGDGGARKRWERQRAREAEAAFFTRRLQAGPKRHRRKNAIVPDRSDPEREARPAL